MYSNDLKYNLQRFLLLIFFFVRRAAYLIAHNGCFVMFYITSDTSFSIKDKFRFYSDNDTPLSGKSIDTYSMFPYKSAFPK